MLTETIHRCDAPGPGPASFVHGSSARGHVPQPGDPLEPPGHAPDPHPLPSDPPGVPVEPDVPQPDEVPQAHVPHDGDANQGGVRPAGLAYQEDLGVAQDA